MNKYSSTSRVLSFLFHLIMFLGFAALGIYFSFFVAPFHFTDPTKFANFSVAYNFSLMFGCFGLALATVSAFGLYYAILGLLHDSDDEPVVKSFVCFFVDGYIASAAFFINASVLWQLTAGTQTAFVIVLYSLIMIALLIATNLPMVKTMEDRNTNETLLGLSAGAGVLFLAKAVINAATLVVNLQRGSFSLYNQINGEIEFYLILDVAAFILLGLAAFLYKKAIKKDLHSSLLASVLLSVAFVPVGCELILGSSYELIFKDYKALFETATNEFAGYGFVVMGYVIGGLIVLGGISLLIINLVSDKKQLEK